MTEAERNARDIASTSDVSDGELTTKGQSSEPARTPSESTSNESQQANRWRLTQQERDEALTYLKELIRDGVIKNTQFTIEP